MTGATDMPWTRAAPVDDAVAGFVPGPGIERLPMTVDVTRLRSSLDAVLEQTDYDRTWGDDGFGVLPVTRRPGTEGREPVDLSGRFWTRSDETYEEFERDELVDEHAYTELVPVFAGTYIAEVVETLRACTTIGRVRINAKAPFNCNSWHRDPEPRIHVPIATNPGCLFTVNNHTTHLPADGSVYFTDTRGYHTALNGGDTVRVHLVAAVLG